MKNSMLGLFILLFVGQLFAEKDVTTFLGIPVDSTKSVMMGKLKAKGFSSVLKTDVLTGEFNGQDVFLSVETNRSKVFRICVSDVASSTEAEIKIRFNNLIRQFKRNKRYIALGNYEIPEDENISYEMSVHSKRFEAVFYQLPDTTESFKAKLKSRMDGLSEEELRYPSDETQRNGDRDELWRAFSVASKKVVWFIIDRYLLGYRIEMFYDNVYNQANGEDL